MTQMTDYTRGLQRAIAIAEEERKQQARQRYEEGKYIKDAAQAAQAKVEAKRQELLEFMDKMDIPQQYRLKLSRKQF